MTAAAMLGIRCTTPPAGAAARAAAAHCAVLPSLETARLRLRAPVITDFPLWRAIYAAPEAVHFGGPFEAETAWEAFSVYTAGWLLHGHGLWAVERRADGVLLGFVHLGLEWDDEEPELGWMFAPEARGQGYASEAAAAARDHALALMPTCVSAIDPENAPSRGVARRLGATLDEAATAAQGIGIWRHGAARP